jgi:hypothetical protein
MSALPPKADKLADKPVCTAAKKHRHVVGIHGTDITEYRLGAAQRSHRLDIGSPDHLAPLLGFFGDELPELGRG